MNNFVKSLLSMLFLIMTSVAFAADSVNINTASAADLAEGLSGIAESRAAAIVADRNTNGPFSKPSDITRVKGIGDKLFEKNKSVIVVSSAPDGTD